jgi:hypothetical protein
MAGIAATVAPPVHGAKKFETNPATRDSSWVKVLVLCV